MSSGSKGDDTPDTTAGGRKCVAWLRDIQKTRVPREHNRWYNDTTSYVTTKESSGLRHERRNVPLAAGSAGTVKS